MRVGILFFAAAGMLATAAYAQDITRVSPNGLVTRSFDRTPEGSPPFHEKGRTAAFLFPDWPRRPTRLRRPQRIRRPAQTPHTQAPARGAMCAHQCERAKSIDICPAARAVARGNISSSTSAHTTN